MLVNIAITFFHQIHWSRDRLHAGPLQLRHHGREGGHQDQLGQGRAGGDPIRGLCRRCMKRTWRFPLQGALSREHDDFVKRREEERKRASEVKTTPDEEGGGGSEAKKAKVEESTD